jgi:predicted DNA-binding transcriptional regulator
MLAPVTGFGLTGFGLISLVDFGWIEFFYAAFSPPDMTIF